MIEGLFFYFFAISAVFASLMVVTVKNSVHSVLWLILTFFTSAGLFLLVGAEFLAMLLVVVYVGAVAVLFLFVIMMLDINTTKVREGFFKRLPLGILFAGIFLFDLVTIILASMQQTQNVARTDYMLSGNHATNTHAIGSILYTDFALHFQVAGLILFSAMIGCIVLTLRSGKFSRKQDTNRQQSRNKETSVSLVKVKTGEGVDVR
jgi:NADH-quinone oxidoreductase subunit J